MQLQLSDLDELNQKTRNLYSKSHLNEAIISYRAGAYRAAVITTWIAVCVDIIEKIRELSTSEDALAQRIEERLNNIQPNEVRAMQTFENELLNIACDQLEIISTIEKLHLERLKEDRNICAHPTFSADGNQFTPSAELTRAYIVQAANYLLTTTPVKGRVVIGQLYDLINSESFPSDEDKAFTVLSSNRHLGRVKPSTIRNLIIILLKKIFKDENRIRTNTIDKICFSLGAISRINNRIYKETINEKLNHLLSTSTDHLLKRLFPFAVIRSEVCSKIEEAILVRLESIISILTTEKFVKYKITHTSSFNSSINDAINLRISEFNESDLLNLLKDLPSSFTKSYAVSIFIESGSFATAYTNGINYLIPHAKFFTSQDIENIFEGVSKNSSYSINQILNAGGIDEVFCSLYEKTKHIINHSELWYNFWEILSEKNHRYEELLNLLVEDDIVKNEVIDTNV